MKKSTIVRTILFGVVIVNMGLKALGHDIIDIDENEVAQLVEYGVSAGILILSWWKNNSFTNKAIEADRYLEVLKGIENNNEEVM